MTKLLTFVLSICLTAGIMLVKDAHAGCQITVRIKNKRSRPVTVDWKQSKVKTKGGTWKKLGTNKITVHGKRTKTHHYSATFGCNAKRRYRINYGGLGGDGNVYYPGTNSWTTKQTFTVVIK